jgi:glycosyltransferase involved in cell wall biosynthesis
MSVYKKEKPQFLDMAFKSIWTDQILKPKQVIVIEDGELTPALKEVLKKWKIEIGSYFVSHRNKENIGLTKSLNIGIQHVTSKYIARMDSDDICLPERFKKQMEFMEQNDDIMVVGSYAQEIDENNNYKSIRKVPISHEVIRKYITKATPLLHPSVMIRSEIFNCGIKYNEKYKVTQDLALWVDILDKNYKITNIPEVLLLFRITKDTFNRRSRTKAIQEFTIYMKGIYRLNRYSFAYIYPFSRLIFRLLPSSFIKRIYSSKLRGKVLE